MRIEPKQIERALEQFDSPITKAEEDLLERSGFVDSVARILKAAPTTESNVFALYGEWGSGKTSLKNLIIQQLGTLVESNSVVVEFNPWAFSGQDQVLEAFFTEISKSLGRVQNGEKAAETFKKLGAYLSYGAKTSKAIHVGMDLFGIPGAKLVGLVGDAFQGGSKNAKDYGEDIGAIGKTSLEQIHSELKQALAGLNGSLLVVIDDLDRLTPEQVLLMFQLVKLNASLPRVNYFLLMDRPTIEDRLKAKQLGPEFIEKIVQFELTMPHIGEAHLKTILQEGLKLILGGFAKLEDWERYENAWTNGCQNILTTLRGVKRFLHTFRFYVTVFENDGVLEANPIDLFIVEILRKYAPDVHAAILGVVGPLVHPTESIWLLLPSIRGEEGKFGEKRLKSLLERAPDDLKAEVQQLLQILFPQLRNVGSAGSRDNEDRWIRDARICHHLFFESYFRLLLPSNTLTQREVAEVFEAMPDPSALRIVMAKHYEKVGLHHLLMRIECCHARMQPQHLSTLMTEVWRLDELDAKQSGVERKWDTRQATQTFSRFFLRQFVSQDERCRVALEALKTSGSVYPFARLVRNELGELKENPHNSDTAFRNEDLEKLRRPAIDAIREAAKSNAFIQMPDFSHLLFFWRDLESKDAVNLWVKALNLDSRDLSKLLSTFVHKGTVSGHGATRTHYYVSRKLLEAFFPTIEDLEKSLLKLRDLSLSHWERFAVDETLTRIDEKKRGVQEPDWRWE